MIEVQFDVGFELVLVFCIVFVWMMGVLFGQMKDNVLLWVDFIEIKLGYMIVVSDVQWFYLLEFVGCKVLLMELKCLWIVIKGNFGFGCFVLMD